MQLLDPELPTILHQNERAILDHAFFEGINWSLIREKEYDPPVTPEVRSLRCVDRLAQAYALKTVETTAGPKTLKASFRPAATMVATLQGAQFHWFSMVSPARDDAEKDSTSAARSGTGGPGHGADCDGPGGRGGLAASEHGY